MCVECGSLFRCVYPRSAPTYLHKLRHSSYWQLQCRQFTAKIVRNNYEHHTVTRICLNEAALVVTKRAHYWRCLSSLVASLSQRCLLIRFIIVRLVCSILYFFFFGATDICIFESRYVRAYTRACFGELNSRQLAIGAVVELFLSTPIFNPTERCRKIKSELLELCLISCLITTGTFLLPVVKSQLPFPLSYSSHCIRRKVLKYM